MKEAITLLRALRDAYKDKGAILQAHVIEVAINHLKRHASTPMRQEPGIEWTT